MRSLSNTSQRFQIIFYIFDTRAAAHHLRRRAGLSLASNLIRYCSVSFSTRPTQTPTRRILVFIARLSYKIPLAWPRQRQASATVFLFLFCFAWFFASARPFWQRNEPAALSLAFPVLWLCVSPAVSLLFSRSFYASPSPTALRLATASSVLAFASASLAITFTKPFSFLREGYIH